MQEVQKDINALLDNEANSEGKSACYTLYSHGITRNHITTIYVIYKPRQLGVYNKYTTHKSEVRGSLPLINPEPKGQGVYQQQTSDDRGQRLYICCIHVMAVVHMIYTIIKSY